jgi:hypothetical protein
MKIVIALRLFSQKDIYMLPSYIRGNIYQRLNRNNVSIEF